MQAPLPYARSAQRRSPRSLSRLSKASSDEGNMGKKDFYSVRIQTSLHGGLGGKWKQVTLQHLRTSYAQL